MMKLKSDEEYSHLKLWSSCNISCELDSFFFLLILLVSILFSVSNRFICYFGLLKFTLRKNIKYGLLCIQQEWLTLVWKLVEYNFNYLTYLCKDVRCKRSKQTVNGSQDRYTIPSCWNNLLRDKQIICLHQADYMRRNWVLIKV